MAREDTREPGIVDDFGFLETGGTLPTAWKADTIRYNHSKREALGKAGG